ncbi:hypothetical protein HanPSC8_Chr15g0675081 [Helianthus annuus]|nr:hypothetical protein HanPSC8_Chr15g0675081 [Helianthus annuus]
MALLKPHHTTYYHSLRLIMSSRFFIPTHGLFIFSVSPTPPSVFFKSWSNLGVRTTIEHRSSSSELSACSAVTDGPPEHAQATERQVQLRYQ